MPGRLDVRSVRRQFPGLSDEFARFDGPAASQVPVSVLDAMYGYLRSANANLGGAFEHSLATDAVVGEARQQLAAFLSASPAEVGFGMNATTVNSRLARALARTLHAGDEIVVTDLDHDANLVPWRELAADLGVVVRTVPATSGTRLNMAALTQAIGDRTRVVAFPWANNVTGTELDVTQVAKLAREAGALVWADGTHYLPHGRVDVGEAGVDVLVGSAYKFLGPHLGVFYLRHELAERWGAGAPGSHPGSAAARFETGTLPFEALAGLTAALRYLDDVGWDFIEDAEQQLGQRFLAGLSPDWQLHGIPAMDGRTATFALTLPGHDPRQVATSLAAQKIAVTAGDFHAPAILRSLGVSAVLRAGILHYNTEDEVDRLLNALNTLAAAH
jgi:cysteine desulfurase family protein (TIGR01976 family)